MTATIRRYRDSDQAAVYEVCVETADTGQGVRGRYSTDDLVPDVLAGPYLFLAPEHAYVLDNGGAPSATSSARPAPGASSLRIRNAGCRGCGPDTSRCRARR